MRPLTAFLMVLPPWLRPWLQALSEYAYGVKWAVLRVQGQLSALQQTLCGPELPVCEEAFDKLQSEAVRLGRMGLAGMEIQQVTHLLLEHIQPAVTDALLDMFGISGSRLAMLRVARLFEEAVAAEARPNSSRLAAALYHLAEGIGGAALQDALLEAVPAGGGGGSTSWLGGGASWMGTGSMPAPSGATARWAGQPAVSFAGAVGMPSSGGPAGYPPTAAPMPRPPPGYGGNQGGGRARGRGQPMLRDRCPTWDGARCHFEAA